MDTVALLTVLVLAGFTGYEVIAKVSSTLHTPLMSGSNAISGIILVGTVVVAARADSALSVTLSLIAVVLATINLVGGFVVTDRMLQMFKARKAPAADREAAK
ncbi:NAD(P) transhydrogenase subunit alpha [Allorhizocola rhizosphaerae]|uniref:NAD(P) transhydrogenase subunit alpha n=1 Tax=Allorhizocola rhizosphaerae TaxID=1872709 RepID=UPI000E3EB5FD|nr:NAD(P) transhydrogenase subunit alpha [Allorhizocola rhizosphaerae]